MKINYHVNIIQVLLVSLVVFASRASCEVRAVEATKSKPGIVTLSAADKGTQEIQFYFVSRGTLSLPVSAYVVAPAGISGTMEAKVLTGAIPTALEDTKGWAKIDLNKSISIGAAKSFAPKAAVVSAATDCSFMTDEIYQLILSMFQYSGQTITWEQACAMLSVNNPSGGSSSSSSSSSGYTPTDPTGTVSGTGVLHKNTCADRNKTKYLVRLRLNISKVADSAFDSGSQISVTLNDYPFSGRMSASLKPTSDGKFAPRPLVLMCTTGGWYGEQINVYREVSKKQKFFRSLKVEDYVYYKGMALARSIASSVLVGGKGTFEITNGSAIYSVCFSLAKRRQNVNGYGG